MAISTTELRTLPARLETLLDMSRQLCRIQPLDALLGSMAEACGSQMPVASMRPTRNCVRVTSKLWCTCAAPTPAACTS